MSGHTERGRGEGEKDFEAIESQLALRRLYTRHKPRTPSHLPLPPPLCTTSPRSLLHHLWPSRPDRGPQTHITPRCHERHCIRQKHFQDGVWGGGTGDRGDRSRELGLMLQATRELRGGGGGGGEHGHGTRIYWHYARIECR